VIGLIGISSLLKNENEKEPKKKKKREKFYSKFGWKEEVEKGDGVSESGLKEAIPCLIGLSNC
jgi:hypothetical protein